MADDRLYLIHIKERNRARDHLQRRGQKCLLCRYKTQDAVMRNLQILAESTQRLSDSLREMHPEVDWLSISGFRKISVHEYLSIDVKRIWDIVEQDLPVLEEQIVKIAREMGLQ